MKPAAMLLSVSAVVAPVVAAQQPVFRSQVDVVRIDASVMRGVRPVGGLTIDNFEVADNGVIQKLESASLDKVALNLMLVFDTSGSLKGEGAEQLRAAASRLIQSLRPDDAAALTTFAEPVRLRVPMSTGRAPMLKALKDLEVGGATSLSDAVFLALQFSGAAPSTDGRSVLLVFSDGRDAGSFLTADQVIDVAKRSHMLIHAVELTATGRRSDFAASLTDAAGGRTWMASNPKDLSELFEKVLSELRNRYLLTYYPSNSQPGWHDVKVSLRNARGTVTARPGYVVP
jgi:VWFA-related protein